MISTCWTEASPAKPFVIAHRGGAALGPENTAQAFRAALDARADAVETDVRRSADGALVCLHDADLQRLCGDPREVAELDLAALQALVPGLLTLEAAIAASAPLNLLLDVKLPDESCLAEIIRNVETGGAVERTMLGLRHLTHIKAARSLSPRIGILALLPDADAVIEAAAAGADGFRFWQGELTADRVALARQTGMKVAVMVGQPRNEPLPEYPAFPVGQVDADGLAKIRELAPDAIMLDDPRLLTA